MLTEDQVRDQAQAILQFHDTDDEAGDATS